MLEYLFFDKKIRDKFIKHLEGQGVEHHIDSDDLIVAVSEDVDDTRGELIDHYYEALLQETAELMEQSEDALDKNVAAVQVQLKDSSTCTVRLDPVLVSRILGCLTMDELRDMVQEVAHWVELKDNSPLCHDVELEKK